jgi:hypothetical protein
MSDQRERAPVPVVFISSTVEDLKPYRAAARDAAIRAKCLPEMCEDWEARGDKPPLDVCLSEVSKADVLVAIVAHRYGWEPPDQVVPKAERKSITWLECERAECERDAEQKKEVLAFVVDPEQAWLPKYMSKKPREISRLDAFKEWLGGPRLRKEFTTPEDLGHKVESALRAWRQRHPSPAATDSPSGASIAKASPAKTLTVPPEYGTWLQEQDPDIDLLGLRPKRGQTVRVNNVYVPLTTMTREIETELRQQPGVDLDKFKLLLDLLGKDSLYLSGAPGSGKSIFCRWAAWLACAGSMPLQSVESPKDYTESFPESFRDRLPVLVRLREFWRHLPQDAGLRELSRADLEHALGAWFDAKKADGVTWADVATHLARGSALVILDGVDEVPLTHGDPRRPAAPREMLIAGLVAAMPHWTKPGNRVPVTSRPYGLTDAQTARLGLPHTPIADLPRPLQELLVRRWFHILADTPAAGETTAADMLNHLRGRDWLRPLAANPMLLTAMCIIYGEGGRLPQDKFDLYNRIVDAVLYNRYPADPKPFDPVRSRLSVIAWGMHTGDGLDEVRSTPQAETTNAELDRMLQR